jgi:hypothetical protein
MVPCVSNRKSRPIPRMRSSLSSGDRVTAGRPSSSKNAATNGSPPGAEGTSRLGACRPPFAGRAAEAAGVPAAGGGCCDAADFGVESAKGDSPCGMVATGSGADGTDDSASGGELKACDCLIESADSSSIFHQSAGKTSLTGGGTSSGISSGLAVGGR